jgi:hypothetical protein
MGAVRATLNNPAGEDYLMKETDGIQILDDIELEEVVGGIRKRPPAKKKKSNVKVDAINTNNGREQLMPIRAVNASKAWEQTS